MLPMSNPKRARAVLIRFLADWMSAYVWMMAPYVAMLFIGLGIEL